LNTGSDLAGKDDMKARKPRITQRVMDKMEERGKWKNIYNEEANKNYRRLRHEFKNCHRPGQK